MSNEDRGGFEQGYEEIQNLMEEEDELLGDGQTEPDVDVEDDYEEQGQKPQKGSPWKWVVIAVAVLVVVVAVLLIGKITKARNNKETASEVPGPVETETETAGPGEQQSEVELPAPTATPAVTPTPVPMPSETPVKTETGNTVVIPAQLVYVGSSPEEIDHYAEEYALKSVTIEADGSAKVLAETTVPSADVDALVAKITEKCSEPGWYFHFLSISANNDQTVFSIVVNELTMSDKEKQTVTDLFLTAGIHAVQSGQKAENLRIDLLNQVGDLVGTIITGPLKLGN